MAHQVKSQDPLHLALDYDALIYNRQTKMRRNNTLKK